MRRSVGSVLCLLLLLAWASPSAGVTLGACPADGGVSLCSTVPVGTGGGGGGCSGVTPGSYTTADITVNADGCITAAANGTAAPLTSLPFSGLTAATVVNQALRVGNLATLAPAGTGTITANALSGAVVVPSGSSLATAGTGTITANSLAGAPTIGSGSTLGPTGTGVLTANALSGAVVVPSGSSLAATGTGTITATAVTGIPDPTAVLTATNVKKVTGKQNVPRVVAYTPSGSPLTVTINCDTTDIATIDALAGDLTLAAPSPCTGTNPEPEQELEVRITSTTPRILTLNAAFCADNGYPLPTATSGISGRFDRLKFRRNSVSNCWGILASTLGVTKGVTTLASSRTFTCNAQIASRCEMQMTETAGGPGTPLVVDDAQMLSPTPTNGDLVWLAFQCTNLQTLTWAAGFLDGIYQTRPTSCPANTNTWLEVLVGYSSVEGGWVVLVGASAGGGSSSFTVTKNLPVTGVKFPTNSPARLDRSGETDKLLFNDTIQQCVSWQFMWPTDYTSGGTIKLNGSMATGNTGSVKYDFSVWKLTPGAAADVDAVSYDASVNACNTATVPATAGFPFTVSCALTNKDGAVAGDNIVLKMCRDAVTDSAPGDGEVGFVEFSYTH